MNATTATKAIEYKSIVILGQLEPKTDPISQAKVDILRAMGQVGWSETREWHAFQMREWLEFYETFGEMSNALRHLADRVRGHYIRQGKRPQVRYQFNDVWVLYIKLDN